MTAKEKILSGIDIARCKGIEIGPLVSPLISKKDGDVRYVDRASTSELKEWYSKDDKIDLDQITEIDYVWGDSSLAEATGHSEYFDYCVAAHVIEHVPDLIGWLQEISAILKYGGIASFSIPDRRYTFDYLRQESTLADCVEAYLTRRRKPSIRHIFDHFSLYAEIDIEKAWQVGYDGADLVPENTKKRIYEVCKSALEDGSYIDSHCWVFTKNSFFEILNSLNELGLIDFRVIAMFNVEKYGHEFVVQLKKYAPGSGGHTSKEKLAGGAEQNRMGILTMEIAANQPGLAQLYYDTGKGFNETESEVVTYSGNSAKELISFSLPGKSVTALRFDPASNPVKMKIYSINGVFSSGESVPVDLLGVKARRYTKVTVTGDAIMVTGRIFNNDPGVLIPVPV